MSSPASLNFAFLAIHDPQLAKAAGDAERLFAEHPEACLMLLRVFGELLAKHVAASAGLYLRGDEGQAALLGRLRGQEVITRDVADLFHALRHVGNKASHELRGDHRTALHLLRVARDLGIWFHRAFGGDPSFKPGPFVPPPDPKQETQQLAQELSELRDKLTKAQGAEIAARSLAKHQANLRQEAETRAAQALQERAEWEDVAQILEREKAESEKQLASLQKARAAAPEEVRAFVSQGVKASEKVVLDEHQTRLIIDQQLRDAGWEADTDTLSYGAGARPEAGKCKAIAEWPTREGPADYVLFIGITAYATVEAKRQTRDVASAIHQAKRYARGLHDVPLPEGAPFGDSGRELQVPFMFATNGRPYLAQHKEKSGIHFLDGRRKQNHARALPGWYSPEGLKELLKQDLAAAEKKLAEEPTDYLKLRDYQLEAIEKVEAAIAQAKRSILVAMATGTGKTKTCIGLLYRLLSSQRFRRVLFLVDRSALGEQTQDAFKEMRFQQQRLFTEIFEVKELDDPRPESDTRVHVATVQAMVKRVLYSDDVPPVDTYDCIVIDECHRGYLLDRELSETELTFRDESDYISKYRRVLDYFDAVKIGLTATPALHTAEIFGKPVFTYSYRKAVVDGFLVDHEPPLRIVTKLSQDGISWQAGEEMLLLDGSTGEVESVTLPDEVSIEIESFNRRVLTENFNKVVCERLAQHIDPNLAEKTLIFCVNDQHADLVVRLLKEAFDAQYGGIDDDLVQKITGKSDEPKKLIRRYKNEHAPSVAVTVDLLTTGIDVPKITNLVFLRRIKSRILYDQMLGRGTRLCADIQKTSFRIFDAVDLYQALSAVTDMKPVVPNPSIPFVTLFSELSTLKDAEAQALVLDQVVAKLRAKERRMDDEARAAFLELTGLSPREFADQLRREGPAAAQVRLHDLPTLAAQLDSKSGKSQRYILSSHEDEFIHETHGYGPGKRPEDYLEAFTRFVHDNLNQIPALIVVTQRPRELTRAHLRELRAAFDQADFRETFLQTAWRDQSNADIAATLIGFVRQAALGDPLLPYAQRVTLAMQQILARSSPPWTAPQRKWLERIGKQLTEHVVVDRTSLDEGLFREQAGGFERLNKQFDGRLDAVLGDIQAAIWQAAR